MAFRETSMTYTKSIADRFVYYERLKNDYSGLFNPMYNKVKSDYNAALNNLDKYIADTTGLRAMAALEYNKEQRILKEHFGISLPMDIEQTDIKDLVKAINEALGIKEIFERNLQLLKSTNRAKPVYSFYAEYFDSAWQDYMNRNLNITNNLINSGDLEKDIELMVTEIMMDALKRMLNDAKTEHQVDDKYQKAYQIIYKSVNDDILNNRSNEFLNGLNEIYDFKNMCNLLIDSIKSQKNLTKYNQNPAHMLKNAWRPKNVKGVINDVHSGVGGGLLQEVIYSYLQNQFKSNLSSSRGGQTRSYKTDNITIAKVDYQYDPYDDIDSIMIENEKLATGAHDTAVEKMNQFVKNFNGDFIIFSNSKNYSLANKYSTQLGYSAGSAVSLEEFYHVVKPVIKNMRTILGLVVNTIPGAIGNPEDQSKISRAFAHAIAFMLFEDSESIGDELDKGPDTIHVLNLNGILIPLSSLLQILANAIRDVNNDITKMDKVVKVKIETPNSIEFPTIGDQAEWEIQNLSTHYQAWNYQKLKAYQETKISYHFLRAIKEIVRQYL